MVRLASWIRPAGGSPVRVSAGAPGTGNAADTFVQIDRHVAWRLKRLLVKRKGRNLRAGEAEQWRALRP